jgi:uncharacterized LabA/DUF88 family protein
MGMLSQLSNGLDVMSTEKLQTEQTAVTTYTPQKIKVLAFIDGFNLYHSLDRFDHGVDDADRARYQKYKWICLTSLVNRFVAPVSEQLVRVEYFTTYPTWDPAKRLRHQVFVSAQQYMGVHVTLGEFKKQIVTCRAQCKRDFEINVEKQTDINIATAMIDLAPEYDKLLLLTADSDQVPALNLISKHYPTKQKAIIIPIGRGAKELTRACDGNAFKITEQHLMESQLPNPIPIMRDGKQVSTLVKPTSW